MKKIIVLLILLLPLLTSCAPSASSKLATPDWTKARSKPTPDLSGYQPNIEAFVVNEQCPHMCWLGINPGVTTPDEAKAALAESDQIDPQMEITDTGIVAKWHTEKTKELTASAYLRFDQGVIKSIAFSDMAPFTLKNFIDLMGDPSGINIDMNIYGDVMEMPYGAYYFTRDVLVGAESADQGLHPNDPVNSLVLNVPYKKELFRLWVGYGGLAEYFKGKEVHEHPAP